MPGLAEQGTRQLSGWDCRPKPGHDPAHTPDTDEIAALSELAGAKVIGVRPHPSFRIVGKIISGRDGLTEISSSRIAGL